MSDPADYFAKQVPEAWNQRLQDERARGEEAAERVAQMCETAFALEVDVADHGVFHLVVENGEMAARDAASADPLVTMKLGREDLDALEDSVGAQPMDLLGGVGGVSDFVLTPARIDGLRSVSGTMRLEVVGDSPWGVLLHFDPPPVPAEPTVRVGIPAAEFAALISGELDLQGAFMTGKLEMEGDVEVPMKIAMAIMAPE